MFWCLYLSTLLKLEILATNLDEFIWIFHCLNHLSEIWRCSIVSSKFEGYANRSVSFANNAMAIWIVSVGPIMLLWGTPASIVSTSDSSELMQKYDLQGMRKVTVLYVWRNADS